MKVGFEYMLVYGSSLRQQLLLVGMLVPVQPCESMPSRAVRERSHFCDAVLIEQYFY